MRAETFERSPLLDCSVHNTQWSTRKGDQHKTRNQHLQQSERFFFNLFILIFLFPNKKNLRFFIFSFNFTIPRKKINKKACIWNRIKRTKYYLHFFFLFWNLLIFSKEKNRKVNNGNKVKSTIWNIIFYFFSKFFIFFFQN